MDLAETTAQDVNKICCSSPTSQSVSIAVQMVTQLTRKIGHVKLAMASAKHVIYVLPLLRLATPVLPLWLCQAMAPVRLCAGERNTKRTPSVSLAMKAVRLVLEARILSVGDVRRGTTLREGVCHTA